MSESKPIGKNENVKSDEIQVRVNNVKKVYHSGKLTVEALQDINLTVEKGSFKMVVGPSGCGKTTLLNLLGGLDSPDTGSIQIALSNGDLQDITELSKNDLTLYRRNHVGIIFQFYNLIPILNALENVELAARFSKIEDPKKKSKSLLEEVGLGDKFEHYPSQLSGGEQQRVAIVRALVKDPALILADEPTGNLDTKKSNEIYRILKKMSEEYGKTILVVSHDEDMADKYAQDHIHIRDGRIIVSEKEAHEKIYLNNNG